MIQYIIGIPVALAVLASLYVASTSRLESKWDLPRPNSSGQTREVKCTIKHRKYSESELQYAVNQVQVYIDLYFYGLSGAPQNANDAVRSILISMNHFRTYYPLDRLIRKAMGHVRSVWEAHQYTSRHGTDY